MTLQVLNFRAAMHQKSTQEETTQMGDQILRYLGATAAPTQVLHEHQVQKVVPIRGQST